MNSVSQTLDVSPLQITKAAERVRDELYQEAPRASGSSMEQPAPAAAPDREADTTIQAKDHLPDQTAVAVP